MDIYDKIAVMKKNDPRTTGGVSGGGTATRARIVLGTRGIPIWCIVKKAESVERDRNTWHWCP